MKVKALAPTAFRRGGEVKIGNVYTNPHGRPHYKIVLGIIIRDNRARPYNNIVLYKVFADGSCAGASVEPEAYVRDHQDLVGTVTNMPTLNIEWLK
jgi:hypothetical protein